MSASWERMKSEVSELRAEVAAMRGRGRLPSALMGDHDARDAIDRVSREWVRSVIVLGVTYTSTEQTTLASLATPAYGGLYVVAGSSSVTITTGGTYYLVNLFTAKSPFSGITGDIATTFDLTVDSGLGGDYLVAFDVSFSANSGTLVKFQVEKGGTETAVRASVLADAGIENCKASDILTLAAADVLTLKVTATNNSDSVTIRDAHFTVHRIAT